MSFPDGAVVAWAHGIDLLTGLPRLDNTNAALVSSGFGLAVALDGTNWIPYGTVFAGTGSLTYAVAGDYTGEVDVPDVLSLGDRATFRPNGDTLVASWYTYRSGSGWSDTGGGGATVVEGTGIIAAGSPYTAVCIHDGTTNTLYSKQGGVVSVVTVPCDPRDSDVHEFRAGLDDETARSLIGKVSHVKAWADVATDTWARAFLDDPTIIEGGSPAFKGRPYYDLMGQSNV
jgi:hypothetical protein